MHLTPSTVYHPTVQRIKNFLDLHHVTYTCFEHEAVRTSEEAATIRPEYSIQQGAKALIVRIKKKVSQSGGLTQGVASDFDAGKNRDNLNSSCQEVPKEEEKQFVQIVVPGDAKFDSKKARHALYAKDIRFATPEEVSEITEGIVPGGVPPFGNLFGLEVYVEKTLLDNNEIIFNAGDRSYSMVITAEGYQKAVQPKIVDIIQ